LGEEGGALYVRIRRFVENTETWSMRVIELPPPRLNLEFVELLRNPAPGGW
jgi:hypothetical protein